MNVCLPKPGRQNSKSNKSRIIAIPGPSAAPRAVARANAADAAILKLNSIASTTYLRLADYSQSTQTFVMAIPTKHISILSKL